MDLQNTRFKLAEAKTKAEVFRSFVNECIARLIKGKLDAATASMANIGDLKSKMKLWMNVCNYMVAMGISWIIQFLECMRMQEYRKYTADQMR